VEKRARMAARPRILVPDIVVLTQEPK